MIIASALAHQRHHGIKAVHQERLAAAYAAPHVHAFRHVRTVDQALEGARTLALVGHPLLVALLQAVHRAALGGVGLEIALFQRMLIKLFDVHVFDSVLRVRK
jgi:hypothetical protein